MLCLRQCSAPCNTEHTPPFPLLPLLHAQLEVQLQGAREELSQCSQAAQAAQQQLEKDIEAQRVKLEGDLATERARLEGELGAARQHADAKQAEVDAKVGGAARPRSYACLCVMSACVVCVVCVPPVRAPFPVCGNAVESHGVLSWCAVESHGVLWSLMVEYTRRPKAGGCSDVLKSWACIGGLELVGLYWWACVGGP